MQESLLAGTITPADMPPRLCQSTALLVGAAAARLVTLHSDGEVEALASYGRDESSTEPPPRRSGAARDGRPARR
jgi:hypothetical protein